jgi:NTP pyrophosphatase (non-canonical NTP hydrolase)
MKKTTKTDADTSLQELKDKIVAFTAERGWEKHHTQKNVAITIAIEAAELLEHFQWDEYNKNDKQGIADELADIMFSCLNFANISGIDMTSAFLDKFERIEKKYPVDKFNPNSDNSEEYFRIKQAYKQRTDKK